MDPIDPAQPIWPGTAPAATDPTAATQGPLALYAPEYEPWYGRSWVSGQPSHMPAFFNTTPQDGPGNQVLPVSIRGPQQNPVLALSSAEVPRQDTTGGQSLRSTTPGGLSGNADSTPYRNLRASRWTDAINPPA